MQQIESIGTPPWTRSDILAHVDEFVSLYAERPIKDNQGGMKSPHMFAVWFMAKYLNPDIIVESGIWKGQSTWLLEKACPDAQLISIDLNLKIREYVSERASYRDTDFAEQNWTNISDRSLAFFDDHQNAYTRLQQCDWFGFKHVIFEDNYPTSQGDCYSLKKAFSESGFDPKNAISSASSNSLVSKIIRKSAQLTGVSPAFLTPQYESARIQPNESDSLTLQKNLDVYHEFPPVVKTEKTRWGDAWENSKYPTPPPLLEQPDQSAHEIFIREAMFYTWICYARLK